MPSSAIYRSSVSADVVELSSFYNLFCIYLHYKKNIVSLTDLMSNFSTELMNVGISLSRSQNPQLWPACDIVTAHTGIDVNISLQGVIKF